MHSLEIIVNNTVLQTSTLLRDQIIIVLTIKKEIIMWRGRGVS